MATVRTIRFSALGWGFLTAWGIEGMLIGPVFDSARFVPAGLVASASNIAAFIAIALLLGLKTRSAANKKGTSSQTAGLFTHVVRWPVVLAAVLMFCGSSGNLLGQTFGPAFRVLEFGSLALASGGYVLLTVLWGRYYASCDSQEIETYAVWSTFLCAVLYFLALVMPAIALVGVWLCLPLASCVCLLLCEKHRKQTAAVTYYYATKKAPLLPYWWFGLSILAASFCITLPTGFGALSVLAPGTLGFTTLSGLVLAVILVIYCTVFARRINLATFYRLLCPLTVGGLFLITLSSPIMAFGGFGLIFAAQWVLYLSVWIYLAELCRRIRVDAIFVFVAGRLMFELGFLLAYLLNGPMIALTTDNHLPLVFIAFGVAVFFVLTTLLPINADEIQPAVPVREDIASGTSSDREILAELFQKQTQRLAQRYALSPRESEIVQYLVRGYSLPSIRNELYIAKSTIDSHAQRIYRKCDVHSRQELIALFNQMADGTEPQDS